jgi:hypothetical protein
MTLYNLKTKTQLTKQAICTDYVGANLYLLMLQPCYFVYFMSVILKQQKNGRNKMRGIWYFLFLSATIIRLAQLECDRCCLHCDCIVKHTILERFVAEAKGTKVKC